MSLAIAVPAISVEDLSFRIGSKQILRGICFSVAGGEYLSIVGPNGAGKSTLIRCLDGILVGGSGRIAIQGCPLEQYRRKELARLVSYVPQADGRVLPFTVEQFVLMGRYPHLSPFTAVGKDDRREARRAMELTGTEEFAHRLLGTLSGGERQKAYLAAALAQGARVLLLDEPTTFLDYRHQMEIRRLLRKINRTSGTTVVAVTHDLNHAALESDRVMALRDGQMAFCGTPQELMRGEVLERIFGTSLLLVDHPQARVPVTVPPVPLQEDA